MGYIYKITNCVNNKGYIGVTTKLNANDRWLAHKSAIRFNRGCPLLQKAFNKYGEKSFVFEILIICFDTDVFRFEKEYIERYKTLSPNGYNVSNGGKIGEGFLGRSHSNETKNILRNKSTVFHNTPEMINKHRQNAIQFNTTHNIGELLRKSEKWKKAKEEGRIGGHSKTEDGKKKISEGLKAYYQRIKTDEEIIIDRKKHSDIMTKRIGRKISQYSKDGILLASFQSIKAAAVETCINRKNINQMLSGRSKSAGGFIWRYDDNKELKD